MNKKFLKFASLSALAFLPFSVSANNEAKLEAEKYIKGTSTFDLFWKGKNPYISGEKYFYNADERKPSYIEYKVSCDKQVDCGYVMVNIDGTYVSIPEASSVGKTSSEIMSEMSGKGSKNYYFGPFEQFSENEKTGELGFINPENNNLLEKDNLLNKQYSSNSSLNVKLEKSSKLRDKFEYMKKLSKEKSINFLNNKSSNITEVSEKNLSKKASGSTGAVVGTNYISEWGCFSYTPCYSQATILYNSYIQGGITHNTNKYGPSGCVPTAFSILYGYYDRNGIMDFVPGELAKFRNTINIVNMQKTLGISMGTELEVDKNGDLSAGTFPSRYIDGVNYLNNLYPKTQEISETFDIDKVKTEIQEGRPVIMVYGGACSDNNGGYFDCNKSGHAIVIHGYMGNSKLIGNFGWDQILLIKL